MDEKIDEQAGASKKTKRMEKPATQVVTNREYLDMDTDEEEFGKQETPEPEEELEIEPDKPVFTQEQLNILVEYVKDLATLPFLEPSSWTPDVVETIAEYFRNPAKTVLTIFHERNTLRSRLDFPYFTDGGLTYFLRSPWQVYTPENFLSTVTFGSVGDRIENSTLRFMENLYAPVAFSSNDWPAVTKNKVFSSLHEFMMGLTDATYNPMGLTILYVPREGLEVEKENNLGVDGNEMEGLIERLERVARHWIRQVREAINAGIGNKSRSSPRKTIANEILYWNYKYQNLSCINNQLRHENVRSIMDKLKGVRSASVKGYEPLLREVRWLLDEATSNITYLNLLEESKEAFSIPDGVDEYARRILLLIRLIGAESTYYRGKEKMERLCCAFGTQAVEHLQRHADLDVIFDGDPVAGKKIVLECIDCCAKISDVYDRIVDMDKSSGTPVICLTEKSQVFSHVDIFIQRCGDLIGISNSRFIFHKNEKSITICGPRANEFAKMYRNIEECFHLTLVEMKNSREDVVDTTSGNWHKRIVSFNEGIRNVENLVKNWIDDLFDNVLNVEDGIETLHGIKGFKRRDNLRETLNNKWKQVWKIFGKEVENCSIFISNDTKFSSFSGKAHTIRGNRLNLSKQYKMLIDASDWFDDCNAQQTITKKYQRALSAMIKKEEDLFQDWQKYLIDEKIDPESAASVPIFVFRANKKIPFLEINLETNALTNIRELDEWTLLNYETKSIFSKNCPKWETLKFRYNKAETLCKLYNDVIQRSSTTEGLFFENLLDELQDNANPGLTKITWKSETFGKYFADCMATITKINESFEDYRMIEENTDSAITQISATTLVDCKTSFWEMLEASKNHLEQSRIQAGIKVVKKCETVLKLLSQLKEKIHMSEAKVSEHWNLYVNDKYEKLKNSLTKCINYSLTSALKFLHGDCLEEIPYGIEIDEKIKKEVEDELAKINGLAFETRFPKQDFFKIFDTKDFNTFIMSIDENQKIAVKKSQIKEIFQFLGNK